MPTQPCQQPASQPNAPSPKVPKKPSSQNSTDFSSSIIKSAIILFCLPCQKLMIHLARPQKLYNALWEAIRHKFYGSGRNIAFLEWEIFRDRVVKRSLLKGLCRCRWINITSRNITKLKVVFSIEELSVNSYYSHLARITII